MNYGVDLVLGYVCLGDDVADCLIAGDSMGIDLSASYSVSSAVTVTKTSVFLTRTRALEKEDPLHAGSRDLPSILYHSRIHLYVFHGGVLHDYHDLAHLYYHLHVKPWWCGAGPTSTIPVVPTPPPGHGVGFERGVNVAGLRGETMMESEATSYGSPWEGEGWTHTHAVPGITSSTFGHHGSSSTTKTTLSSTISVLSTAVPVTTASLLTSSVSDSVTTTVPSSSPLLTYRTDL